MARILGAYADPSGANVPVGDGISIMGSHRLVVSLVDSADPAITYNDFLDNDCFDFLVLDERAGFRLPMIKLGFRIYDYSILSYLNQGNTLVIYVTSSRLDVDGTLVEDVGVLANYLLLKPKITSDGNMKNVVLTGVLNKIGFVDNRHTRVFENMPSTDAFFWIACQYFGTDFGDNPNIPNDTQNWVQSNMSDKDFMKHLFTHTNYEGSFPIVGITINGVFRHRDFRYHVIDTDPVFRFTYADTVPTPVPPDPIEIVHNGDIIDVSNAGMINLWRGAGAVIPVIDAVTGGIPVNHQSSADVGLLTGLTVSNRRIAASPALLSIEYDGGNTYDGFIEAKSRNISGAAMYSSQILSFTYKWKFHPIQVLDFVIVEDVEGQELGASVPTLPSMTASGKYVVSRVTRKISKHITTRIEVCRDCPMEQIGALK